MIKVGILSATGYMGGEALRVLLDHPHVEIAWLTGRSGGQISDYHPNLFGLDLPLIHPSEVTPCDVVFLTVPTTATFEVIDKLLEQGARVIDLGSAFRLKSRETWERVYGQTHSRWHLVEEAVYGITELHGNEVAEARLVSNPGCFSSAAISLPLARMKVPVPCCVSRSPRTSSSLYALMTVLGFTDSCTARRRTVGSWSPAVSPPFAMANRIWDMIWR